MTPNFTSRRVQNGHLDAVRGELIDDRAERVLLVSAQRLDPRHHSRI